MKHKGRIARNVKTTLVHVLLVAFIIVALYPIFYAFVSSFKSAGEILAGQNLWPEVWHWENYAEAWNQANFSTYTWNTIVYSTATMFFCVLMNSMSGYVYARGEFPGKNIIFAVKTAMMFVALGSTAMYPQLQILKALHLNQSLVGLVVQTIFTGSITYIFMIRSFVMSLPKELDDAATIDGCSFMGIFFRITLPLIRPIIATIAVLSFKGAWNEYLFPMIVTFSNENRRTLAVGLYYMQTSSSSADWSKMLPGAIISAVPLVVIYIFLNKYFIESLTVGAVKG
ncbi:MAG: carbohydrate ABC transporter permease [Lachnospiraceae bacterium]|nr:carbohydrate ABC transporter permease [Lachnospiraceae bacterium]